MARTKSIDSIEQKIEKAKDDVDRAKAKYESSPVLSVMENNLSRKAFRRNWARLINGSRLVVRSVG